MCYAFIIKNNGRERRKKLYCELHDLKPKWLIFFYCFKKFSFPRVILTTKIVGKLSSCKKEEFLIVFLFFSSVTLNFLNGF